MYLLQRRKRAECNAGPLHDTKAHRGSVGVVSVISILGIRWRWAISLTPSYVNHLLPRIVIFTREPVNRPTITVVALCQKSKFDDFYWALQWLSSVLQSQSTFCLFPAVGRCSDSNVTGRGASYFAIELQGLNVDLVCSSVMNVFVCLYWNSCSWRIQFAYC